MAYKYSYIALYRSSRINVVLTIGGLCSCGDTRSAARRIVLMWQTWVTQIISPSIVVYRYYISMDATELLHSNWIRLD